jgi:hypothetical protein
MTQNPPSLTVFQKYYLRFDLGRALPWCFTIFAVVSLMGGCGIRRWDSTPSPNISGTNAMAGVSTFIATYGWNASTNEEDLYHWNGLQSHYIHDLPWTQFTNQQFQALTHKGILYVLTNPGWDDYSGVAYNPQTNHFPAFIEGFKPIGSHWYVWCIMPPRNKWPKLYE